MWVRVLVHLHERVCNCAFVCACMCAYYNSVNAVYMPVLIAWMGEMSHQCLPMRLACTGILW